MHSYLAFLGLAAAVNGHFVLQIPTSLGYDDANETTAPCDTFEPTTRDPLGNWAIGGDSIGILTTHPSVTWEFKVALVSDTLNWMPLVESFKQTSGVGDVCFSGIPGFDAWIGRPVVLQLIQHAPDGDLYQCAAIQFVAGGPAPVPGDCTTSSGVSYGPIVPAPPPVVGTSSSSATPIPTTSSATSSVASTTLTTAGAGTTPVSSQSTSAVTTASVSSSSSSSAGSVSTPTISLASSSYPASVTNTITTSAASVHSGNATTTGKPTSATTVTVNGASAMRYSMTLVAGALAVLAFLL